MMKEVTIDSSSFQVCVLKIASILLADNVCLIKASGRNITKAVDICEFITKRFFTNVKYKEMKIGSIRKGGNNNRLLSTVDIALERIKKPKPLIKIKRIDSEEPSKVFQINEFLKLELSFGETSIFVKNKYFSICKKLIVNLPVNSLEDFNKIESIDDLKPFENQQFKMDPETEFWGHCSNLQAWAESGYDTRLLHSNLSFPLLKKLFEEGDPQAKKVFKEEIYNRMNESKIVAQYLIKQRYLRFFEIDELIYLVEALPQYDFFKDFNLRDLFTNFFPLLFNISCYYCMPYSLDSRDLGWLIPSTLKKHSSLLEVLKEYKYYKISLRCYKCGKNYNDL